MKNLIFVFCLLVSGAAVADDEFVLVDKDDKKMNEAFKKAKSTLGAFLELVDKGRDENSIYGAYIKIEDKGETEYLWVTDVQKYDDQYYIGYVISKPQLVTTVKYGATIGYLVSDIYDWQHYDKKKNITHGAYTTCALLDATSEEDNEYIKQNGLQCEKH